MKTLPPQTILIVDDHPTNLKLLRAQLEAEGFTVIEAADGREALALLGRETVDAIVSNVLMPRVDGYRLCYEVRQDERLRHLPFLFYSGNCTSSADEKLARDLTADRFIRKPASPDVIVKALRGVLSETRSGQPGPPREFDALTVLKQYSERLVSKLAERNAELAQAYEKNRSTEENRRLHATALETAANAILLTDVKGIIQWVNPAFTRLTGYTAEEAIGQTPRLLKSGRHDRDFYQQFWNTILSGQTWRGEFINRRKDGSLFYDEHTVTPFRSTGGSITHFVNIMNDVTERKRLDEQFMQAQKMQVIGHLAGGVAHDFNNILVVIMGYSELLLQEIKPDHPLHECVEQIRLAGERATGLTRQLLVFSRKQILQPVVLDLNELIAGMDKMLRRLIDESITLTVIPGKQLGRVKADPGCIGQVVMNLAVNARDAMPSGGNLTLETRNITVNETGSGSAALPPGNYVMLAVSDTGIGMTEEVKAHLFEAFFTTKPKGKGTGLGLVTCQSIVKQAKGYMEVSSEFAKGTTFKVYLPRVDGPLDSESPDI